MNTAGNISDCACLSGSSSVPQEKRFTFNGFTYAAQFWDNRPSVIENSDVTINLEKKTTPHRLPVIMLHGWLDNSASFNILAHQLTHRQCLAIDLAGHGLSDHKAGWADYPLWSEVGSVYAIADAMGWERFILIGHSRGAMMSLITAGTFPERIGQLVCIDSLLPHVLTPEKTVLRMQQSIGEIKQRLHRKLSLYPSYESAINARCNSRFAPVTSATAQILASRGLRRIDNQFHWHADGKLWAVSNIELSADMLSVFVDSIVHQNIPCLLLLGSEGLINDLNADPVFNRQCKALANQLSAQINTYDDGHFLHLERASNDVANDINQFIAYGI